MELRQLRNFVRVAQLGSLSSAAEQIGLTQPALSRQLRALEDELGLVLLNRHARGVSLTPDGETYLADMSRVLAELDGSTARIRRAALGLEGSLHIAFSSPAARDALVIESFRRLREAAPGLNLRLTSMRSQEQRKALSAGEIDAGFMYFRPEGVAGWEALRIHEEHCVLALPSFHSLADMTGLSLRQVAHEPFVLTSRESNQPFYDHVMAGFAQLGVAPRIVQEVGNEHAILKLVAVGFGLSFLQSSASDLNVAGVRLKTLDDFSPSMPLDLAWRPDRTSPQLSRYLDLIRDLAKTRPSEAS